MNKNIWIATVMAILAPMMVNAGDHHKTSKLSDLDIAKINREAAALAKRLSAPSPQEFDLVKVGELADRQQELEAQEEQEQAKNGGQKTPRSPSLRAQFKQFEQAVRNLIPLSPAALTRSVSAPSPQFRSLAAKEVTAY